VEQLDGSPRRVTRERAESPFGLVAFGYMAQPRPNRRQLEGWVYEEKVDGWRILAHKVAL